MDLARPRAKDQAYHKRMRRFLLLQTWRRPFDKRGRFCKTQRHQSRQAALRRSALQLVGAGLVPARIARRAMTVIVLRTIRAATIKCTHSGCPYSETRVY